MATLTKSRGNGKPSGKVKPVAVGIGVFLEHEYPVGEPMDPVLLLKTQNKFEAIGWSDCWHVDDPDFLNAKMVIRRIDSDGKPIGLKGGDA